MNSCLPEQQSSILQNDKYQNFLDEIAKVEQNIAANFNDDFRRTLIAPDLYKPVATLWNSFENKGSAETKELFRNAVKEYIDRSQDVADKLIFDYEKERKKQPERSNELLIENRDWYVKRLADVYVPIDLWYHDFWDEHTQTVNDVDGLEVKIFIFCYQIDKPFMVGLRLLRDLYGYYHAIDRFNKLMQQGRHIQHVDGSSTPPATNKPKQQRQQRPVTVARDKRLRELVENFMKVEGKPQLEAMQLAAKKEGCSIDTVERAVGWRTWQ